MFTGWPPWNTRSTEAGIPPNFPYAKFGIPYTNEPSGQVRRDLAGRIHQPLYRLDGVLELVLFVIVELDLDNPLDATGTPT